MKVWSWLWLKKQSCVKKKHAGRKEATIDSGKKEIVEIIAKNNTQGTREEFRREFVENVNTLSKQRKNVRIEAELRVTIDEQFKES